MVLASAGEDGKISLWRKNGQSLWMVPAKNARGETVEVHCLNLECCLRFLEFFFSTRTLDCKAEFYFFESSEMVAEVPTNIL